MANNPTIDFEFPFYGKTYTSVWLSDNGYLKFSTEFLDYGPSESEFKSGAPMIAPLFTDLYPESGGNIQVQSTTDYFKASWNNCENFWYSGTSTFSTTLYYNSGWIRFDYDNVATGGYPAIVGLSPGNKMNGDHPGEGTDRSWNSADLSGLGEYPYWDGVNYEGVYEYWRSLNDSGHPFDLGNSFLIFRPGSPKYSLTLGSRDMVVDMQSLDHAIVAVGNDPDLLSTVDSGEYLPGSFSVDGTTGGFAGAWSGYSPGLQTVGVDERGDPKIFLSQHTLETIETNSFIAYAAQVEEDRMNQKILEMHRDLARADLLPEINNALDSGMIRARDDLLTQLADAQTGRVLKDSSGNWVRVQQYVLKPDDKTVQVLNVSLRGGHGPLSGMSTMDWQTSFNQNISGKNLKTLPWSKWLDTGIDHGRYVSTTLSAPELDAMSVKLTNPASESLRESRSFGRKMNVPGFGNIQSISNEYLTLNDVNTYGYSGFPSRSQYSIHANSGTAVTPGGFSYVFGDDTPSLNVEFFVVGDGDMLDNRGVISGYSDQNFRNIWDAFRVNENGAPYIGQNNLEVFVDPNTGVYDMPINVVFVPMSRMLWR